MVNKNTLVPFVVFGAIVAVSLLYNKKQAPQPKPAVSMQKSKWVTAPSGLKYSILRAGKGAPPTRGKRVKVHYTGWLFEGYNPDGSPKKGKQFDSSRKRRQPFTFSLGLRQVIPGWDQTLAQMKKGERRVVVIPYKLAYGKAGRPPVIPPKSILIFDIELLDF